MASDRDILGKLSSRDIEVLVCALYCQKTEPQVDYAALAARAGFKNAASASACYRPIKNKLDAFIAAKDADNEGNGLSSSPITPSRKRKAAAANAANDSPDQGAPPAKKRGRGRPPKAKKGVLEKVEKMEELDVKEEEGAEDPVPDKMPRSFDELMEEGALGEI